MSNRTASALTLPRPLVQQLFAHAQSSPEAEICGLVGRLANGQLRLHRIRNTATDQGRRFNMDTAEQIAAMQTMRKAGESLFAIYHSHPTAPAEPSALDLERIGYPNAWQLIISLNTRGVLELRAWQLSDGKACEAPLRIIED